MQSGQYFRNRGSIHILHTSYTFSRFRGIIDLAYCITSLIAYEIGLPTICNKWGFTVEWIWRCRNHRAGIAWDMSSHCNEYLTSSRLRAPDEIFVDRCLLKINFSTRSSESTSAQCLISWRKVYKSAPYSASVYDEHAGAYFIIESI